MVRYANRVGYILGYDISYNHKYEPSGCLPSNIILTSIDGGVNISFTPCADTQTEIWANIDNAGWELLTTLNIDVDTYDHSGLYANYIEYQLRSRLVALNAPLNLSYEIITGGLRLTWDDNNDDATHLELYANIAGAGYVLLSDAIEDGVGSYDHIINLYSETTILYKIRAKETEFYSEYSEELTVVAPANISEGEVVILAGNTVGWYDPTDTNLIRDLGSGETDIWWDKMYGKEGELGSIQETGASIIYTVYQITACAANYFYTGCKVGDIWACSAVKALSSTNSLKKFTGNHLTGYIANTKPVNHIFDGSDDYLKTPAFTLVRPVFIYFVGKQITWTLNDTILDGGGSTSAKLQQNTTTPKIRLNNGVTSPDNANFPVDTLCILRLSMTVGGGSVQVNNTTATAGPTGTNEMNGFTVGCQGGLGIHSNIDIREIIVRNKTDDAGDQVKIYNYLATKHGLPTI
jgi:hypothetical protein